MYTKNCLIKAMMLVETIKEKSSLEPNSIKVGKLEINNKEIINLVNHFQKNKKVLIRVKDENNVMLNHVYYEKTEDNEKDFINQLAK
jgi:hypothetical protein